MKVPLWIVFACLDSLLQHRRSCSPPLWCCHFYRNDLRSLKAPEKPILRADGKETVQIFRRSLKLDGIEKLNAPLHKCQLQLSDRRKWLKGTMLLITFTKWRLYRCFPKAFSSRCPLMQMLFNIFLFSALNPKTKGTFRGSIITCLVVGRLRPAAGFSRV